MSIANHRPMLTKMLVSAAIVVGACVVGAAPASADPGPAAFRALSCSCQETAPAGSPRLTDEIARGIAAGRSDR